MDSVEIVQPVATLSESIADLPSIREVPAVDRSSSPAQPKFSPGTDVPEEPLSASEPHEISTSEVVALAIQDADEVANSVVCEGGKVEGAFETVQTVLEKDSEALAELGKESERSSDAAIDVEVEISVGVGDSSASEPVVADETLAKETTDIVEISVENSTRNSNAEGISVEVVLEEEVRPDADQVQIVLPEIEAEKEAATSLVVAVEKSARIEILAGCSDPVEDEGSIRSPRPGLKLHVEPMFIETAAIVHPAINSVACEEQSEAPADEGKMQEFAVGAISPLETEIANAAMQVVDVVKLSATGSDMAGAIERDAVTELVLPGVTMAIADAEDANSNRVEKACAHQSEGRVDSVADTAGDTAIGIGEVEDTKVSALESGEGMSFPPTESRVEKNTIVVELGSEVVSSASEVGGDTEVLPPVVLDEPNAGDQSRPEIMDIPAEESFITVTAALHVSRTSEDGMDGGLVLVQSSKSNEQVDASLLLNSSQTQENTAAKGGASVAEADVMRSAEIEVSANAEGLPAAVGEFNPSDILESEQGNLSIEEGSIVVELNASSAFLSSNELGDTAFDGNEKTSGDEVVDGNDEGMPSVPKADDDIEHAAEKDAVALVDSTILTAADNEVSKIDGESDTSSVLVFARDATKLDDHVGTSISDATTEELPPVTSVPPADVLPEIPEVLCTEEIEIAESAIREQNALAEKSSVISIEEAGVTSIEEDAPAVDGLMEDAPRVCAIKLEIPTADSNCSGITVEKVDVDVEMETAKGAQTTAVSEAERSANVITAVDTEIAEKGPQMEMSDTFETTFVETVITMEEVKSTVEADEVSRVVALEAISATDISIAVASGDGMGGNGVDDHGVLIGVGSSVERSGLKIMEIAQTPVLAEENYADKQKQSLSDEPLITSPLEDGVSLHINDGSAVVLERDVGNEINAFQSSSLTPTETTQMQSSETTVLVEAFLETGTEPESAIDTAVSRVTEAATSDKEGASEPVGLTVTLEISRETYVSGTLENSLETTTAAVDCGMESVADVEVTAEIKAEEEKAASSAVSFEHGSDSVESEDPGFKSEVAAAISESQEAEISAVSAEPLMSLETPSPLGGTTKKEVSEEVPSVASREADSITTTREEYSSDMALPADIRDISLLAEKSIVNLDVVSKVEVLLDLASTANGSGVGIAGAADSSAFKDEDAGLVERIATELGPAEDSIAAVVDMNPDGSGEFGASASVINPGDNSIVVEEATIEKNEKKRGREEEHVIAEEVEKTSKSAKTANGEVTVIEDEVNAVEMKDAKVDKKRARDDSDTAVDDAEELLKAKAPKTSTNDDDAGSQSPKSDIKEDVDLEVEELGKDDSAEVGNESTSKRFKKRKIAMFLGYCGAGYQGMQKNPGAITIEGELEEALFRAGAIQESNYGDPKKVDWRRAARTDKGVSAVGQVVSGCFIIDPPGFLERVNSHLPKQIRLYGYKRVTASFNAKKLCDRRKYEYVLPVYSFDPSVHLDRETVRAQSSKEASMVLETEGVTVVEAKESRVVKEGEELNVMNETKELNILGTKNIEGPTEGNTTTATDSSMQLDVTLPENPEMGDGEVLKPNGGGLELVNKERVTVEGSMAEVEEIAVIDNQTLSNGTGIIHEELNVEVKVTAENQIANEAKEDVMMVASESELISTVQKEENVVTGESQPMVWKVVSEIEGNIGEEPSKPQQAVKIQVENDRGLEQKVVAVEPLGVRELNGDEIRQALDEKVKISTYKFGDADLNRLNKILQKYVGSHNFHNFTNRVKADDPSAQRYIVSFEAEDVITIDGKDFVRCTVVGQSFMLHQIRKMIGLAVAIMRGNVPESIIGTALRRDTDVNMPLAPELGLFLEECYYASYNNRFRATHDEISLIPFAKDVKEFKRDFIYEHIAATEARDSTFALWLHSINDRHFPHFVEAREKAILERSEQGGS